MKLGIILSQTEPETVFNALRIKAVFLFLAVLGDASLWLAILADTGATLVVIANALRLLLRRDRHEDVVMPTMRAACLKSWGERLSGACHAHRGGSEGRAL